MSTAPAVGISPATPPPHPLLRASASQLVTLLREREVSAVELLSAVLCRADEISGTVNPFAVRLDDAAMEAAEESDRRIARGAARPLEGLPVSAKDSQWLAGVPTTTGSGARSGFVPRATVGSLQRVIDAGAVIFAKTTTSEFCYPGTSTAPAFGVTANPHDLRMTAGGSSGGAAAHVAAWAGPVGLGGDGGGSIRIPAAFCGLVGHKPTFRRELFANPFNIVFTFLFPLAGAIMLTIVFVISLIDSFDPANGSGASIGGVGLVFVLALGLLVLGAVLMVIQRLREPEFFRGATLRRDTPALIVPE